MKIFDKPTVLDVFVLSLFVLLITFQPYFQHGEINFFEVGLYLPGIEAVLNGAIPYRDVFHLRGPLELYIPACLMQLFGGHIKWLYVYFYAGNVLCLILACWIAKELFKTRFILYLFVPVLIARTFPRVVFTYWGGLRYALGLLAMWMVLKYFKTGKNHWMFLSGVASAFGLLTSVEMGIYPLLGVFVALTVSIILKIQNQRTVIRAFSIYIAGMMLIMIPYFIFMMSQQALVAYLDSVWTVVVRMQKVIDPHFVSIYPRNFPEALWAMLNPVHTNFKHMTPSYLYIFVILYLIYRKRRGQFSKKDLFIIALSVYGFVMYNTGFRGIWAAQFEMSLQPEKVLLFFLAEFILLEFRKQKQTSSLPVSPLSMSQEVKWFGKRALPFYIFAGVLFFSSIGYSIARYNHRFYAFQYVSRALTGKNTERLKPWNKTPSVALTVPRAKGIMVPVSQGEDIEALYDFVSENIGPHEELFTYPDYGTYNFLFDRPSPGRFPMATFAWFNDDWQKEFLTKLKNSPPPFVVLEKNIPEYWKAVYLALAPNRQKFRDTIGFIQGNYRTVKETRSFYILTYTPPAVK